ncbi:hypothetical protein MAUB_41400 [Mycolicibacterium aubagnense]|uniref:Uncharacterized protein n=1 Tax=Mycolicibacterium aubagnense TaxID=319707 RepID=A0ABN5YWI8_9MYCO|nr:hypothetical protein MAUB_41400 [Mycolicibacterium aubagnense]
MLGRSVSVAVFSGDIFSSLLVDSGVIRIQASHNKRAPDPDADHGAEGKQLNPGYRRPVPVEKSLLRIEHVLSVPSRPVPAQRAERSDGEMRGLSHPGGKFELI